MNSLAERILEAFPSVSYSLSALMRLVDIVESDEVPTALVECRVQPRLLVNPAFVAQHAATPEKLLMLVMHELHHILLGHTTQFPRATPVQNFVFDAVINGIICLMFPRDEHIAFFRDYYSEKSFPACLLAPPPGWPKQRKRMAVGLKQLPAHKRAQAHAVHLALYSATGASYEEVCELLPQLLATVRLPVTGDREPDEYATELVREVPLLGGHSEDTLQASGLEARSPILFEVVRDIVEQWQSAPPSIHGRVLADVQQQCVAAARPTPSNRNRLRRLIQKVSGLTGTGSMPKLRDDHAESLMPIPTLARRSLVQRALGHQPLLHSGTISSRRRAPAGERVHVYLDVSGSMTGVLQALYGAILDSAAFVAPRVHLFSTEVVDITLAELRAGKCETTGGTDINCVAEHMALHRVTRALLVTDGYVGTPSGERHAILAEAHVAVAYLGIDTNQTALAAVARHTCVLTTEASS